MKYIITDGNGNYLCFYSFKWIIGGKDMRRQFDTQSEAQTLLDHLNDTDDFTYYPFQVEEEGVRIIKHNFA